MNSVSRIGAIFSLIAALALWTGCDSAGTDGTGGDTALPAVEFTTSGTGAVPVDSIIDVGVTLTDSVGEEVSVEVLFATQASSATPADIGGFDGDPPTKTVSFPDTAPAGATQSFAVDVSNADISEGSKEAFFALQQLESQGSVEIGEPREFSLSIGAKPITEARSQARQAIVGGDDRSGTVTVRGTVTRAFGAFVRFQDDSGPTGASGLVIRQAGGELSEDFQQDISDGTIQPGTVLLVSGSISQFSGLLQINGEDLGSYDVLAQGDPPEPQEVSFSDLAAPDGETYESELLRVTGLSFPDASGTFESGTTYTVENEDGTTFQFRLQDSDETNAIGASIPDGTFTYEGILGQFNVFSGVDADEGYQLIPVQPSDIKQE